jgi:hypothetical protein
MMDFDQPLPDFTKSLTSPSSILEDTKITFIDDYDRDYEMESSEITHLQNSLSNLHIKLDAPPKTNKSAFTLIFIQLQNDEKKDNTPIHNYGRVTRTRHQQRIPKSQVHKSNNSQKMKHKSKFVLAKVRDFQQKDLSDDYERPGITWEELLDKPAK